MGFIGEFFRNLREVIARARKNAYAQAEVETHVKEEIKRDLSNAASPEHAAACRDLLRRLAIIERDISMPMDKRLDLLLNLQLELYGLRGYHGARASDRGK